MEKKADGSITIFLTLTFLVMIALGCGMVELARGSVCKNQAQRLLRVGTESLLAEYSEPMYKEYRLFFLEDAGKSYEDTIKFYINKNLEQPKSLLPITDLFGGTLEEVNVPDKTYVTEDGGKPMLDQICEYMKREGISQIFDNIKGNKAALDSMEATANEIEKDTAEQKEKAKEGMELVQWMEMIDGVCVKNGNVKEKTIFAKMFFHGKKQAQTFHISDQNIWEKMENKVVSIDEMLKDISSKEQERKKYLKMFQQLENLCSRLVSEAEQNMEMCKSVPGRDTLAEELKTNQSILSQSSMLLSQTWSEESDKEMQALWAEYKMPSMCFDYNGMEEDGGGENPLDSFSKAMSEGVLKMVMEDYSKVSEQTVENPDHYLQLIQEQEKEKRSDPVKTLTDDENVDFQNSAQKMGSFAATEVCLLAYLKKFFSNVTETAGSDNVLRYEWEYLICAERSDKENLSGVIERIVLLRTAANASALFVSAKSRETTHAAALAVVGFTAIEPLIRFMQTLFTVLWGMAEAVVDTAAILQGKEVPFVKTADKFSVDFTELFAFTHDLVMQKARQYKKADKRSFGYEEYLSFFLLAMDRSTVCARMMDLMEWKIQKKYVPGFRLGLCTSRFNVTAKFVYPWKLPFRRLPEVDFTVETSQQAEY